MSIMREFGKIAAIGKALSAAGHEFSHWANRPRNIPVKTSGSGSLLEEIMRRAKDAGFPTGTGAPPKVLPSPILKPRDIQLPKGIPLPSKMKRRYPWDEKPSNREPFDEKPGPVGGNI